MELDGSILKKKINKFLYGIGMKTTHIGFCYWVVAIYYYIARKQKSHFAIVTMSNIYNYLSNRYKVSVDSIEKAMRFAKVKSNYMEVFNIDEKMKNHEFLIKCAETIMDNFHE